MTTSQSVGQILTSLAAGLSHVIAKAAALQELTENLRQIVDDPIKSHVFVANLRENTLIVATDSSVWLTRIRYLSSIFLEHMQQVPGLETLKNLEFKVQPFLSVLHPVNRVPISPSRQSAQRMAISSEQISDPALKAALQRLMQRRAHGES